MRRPRKTTRHRGAYGTYHRGRVKIRSLKQLRYMRIHRLPHTEFRRSTRGRHRGRVYRVRVR